MLLCLKTDNHSQLKNSAKISQKSNFYYQFLLQEHNPNTFIGFNNDNFFLLLILHEGLGFDCGLYWARLGSRLYISFKYSPKFFFILCLRWKEQLLFGTGLFFFFFSCLWSQEQEKASQTMQLNLKLKLRYDKYYVHSHLSDQSLSYLWAGK